MVREVVHEVWCSGVMYWCGVVVGYLCCKLLVGRVV